LSAFFQNFSAVYQRLVVSNCMTTNGYQTFLFSGKIAAWKNCEQCSRYTLLYLNGQAVITHVFPNSMFAACA